MFDQRQSKSSPFTGVVGVLVAIVAFFMLFKIASFFFWLLWKVGPLLFIASLIIDHKVFTGYVNNIYSLFQRNWVYGLVAGAFSVVLFPLVALYLLGMALFKKKVGQAQEEAYNRRHGELIDYEEIDSEPMDLDIPEELPPPPSAARRQGGNTYDDYFK